MSLQDPIADMFIRIKNAQAIKKPKVEMPFSKLKASIAQVLLKEGYIRGLDITTDEKQKLVLTLKYYQGKPVISLLKRMSSPGCRVYRGRDKLPRVMGGIGTSIISTAQKGVVSGRVAYSNRLGGEVLGLVA